MKRKLRTLSVTVAMVCVAGGTLQACGNLIVNGDFEDHDFSGSYRQLLGVESPGFVGWSVESGNVDLYYNDGSFLDMNGDYPGAVSQTFPTIPGATYDVSFSMGGNPDPYYQPSLKTMTVSAAGSSAAFECETSHSSWNWSTRAWAFTASGKTTKLEFRSTSGTGWNRAGPALDNVTVEYKVSPYQDSIIPGVPLYDQLTGPVLSNCGPTAAGMVLGYWDGKGPPYSALVLGDASTQTFGVMSMIATIDVTSGHQIRELLPGAINSYTWGVTHPGFPVPLFAEYWHGEITEQTIRSNIDNLRPGIVYQQKGSEQGHALVVVGYREAYSVTSGRWEMTELYVQNPEPSGARRYRIDWTDPSLKDCFFVHPLAELPSTTIMALMGGDFEDSQSLEAYSISGAGGAALTKVAGTDGQVLALTGDHGSVTLSQTTCLAFGQGLVISLDYILPGDGELEVLIDDDVVMTLDDPVADMTHVEFYVDTGGMGLDPLTQQVLSLRFSSGNESTVYVDKLWAAVQPVPEPATFTLLAFGGLALARRRTSTAVVQ